MGVQHPGSPYGDILARLDALDRRLSRSNVGFVADLAGLDRRTTELSERIDGLALGEIDRNLIWSRITREADRLDDLEARIPDETETMRRLGSLEDRLLRLVQRLDEIDNANATEALDSRPPMDECPTIVMPASGRMQILASNGWVNIVSDDSYLREDSLKATSIGFEPPPPADPTYVLGRPKPAWLEWLIRGFG